MGLEGIEPSTFPASAGRSPNELQAHKKEMFIAFLKVYT